MTRSSQIQAGPSKHRQTRNDNRIIENEIPPSSPIYSDLNSIESTSPVKDRNNRYDTASSDPLAFSESPKIYRKQISKHIESDDPLATAIEDQEEEEPEEQYIPKYRPNIVSHTSSNSISGSEVKRKPGRPRKDINNHNLDKIRNGSNSRNTSREGSTSSLRPNNKPISRQPTITPVHRTSAASTSNQGYAIEVDSDLESTSSYSNRRTRQPVVEILMMPLEEIRIYSHLRRNTTNPTERSRRMLFDETNSYESEEGSSKESNRKKRRESSPSYGENIEGEEDGYLSEDDFGEDFEESEIDDLALRRSGRSEVVNKRRGRSEEEDEIATRTRGKRPISIESSPLSTLSSSESDSNDTRQRWKGKGKSKQNNNMVLKTKRKQKALSSDEDFMILSGSSSDHLESDESNYAKPNKKSKGKGKSSDGKVKATEDDLYTHRPVCEKCSREPADEILFRAQNKKNRKKKKRRNDEEDGDAISDEELVDMLQGWLECEKCVVSSHWGCLTPAQKKDVLTDLREREGSPEEGEKPRRSVEIDESGTFICAKCTLNPNCFVCHKDDTKEKKDQHPKQNNGDYKGVNGDHDEDVDMDADKVKSKEDEEEEIPKFRCLRCKQCVHYDHLERPHSLGKNPSLPEVAYHYQNNTEEGNAWICHQCREWIWTVDIIIAWRPSPPSAIEPELEEDEKANWKDPLPREYLIKWTGRGFRHVTWVPHPWLQVLSPGRLRHFLEKGPNLDLITDETLAAKGDEMEQPTISKLTAEDDQVSGRKSGHSLEHGGGQEGKKEWKGIGPGPEVDAQSSLPIEWSTIDRVLDVMLLPLPRAPVSSAPKRGKRIMSKSLSASVSERSTPAPPTKNSDLSPADTMRKKLGLKDGQQPPYDKQLDIDDWEEEYDRDLDENDVDEVAGLVTWCFAKWDDLQHDQSTWDTPPPTESPLYPAFKHALARFLRARKVEIPVLTSSQCRLRDTGAEGLYVPPKRQPDCIVGGELMPFQMEGFQWLLYKHFRRESCILADDMGLGKTIQIASVLGYLGSSQYKIYPCLVVVPNSTITNWVREFEKWVPHIRVVAYYGEAASRKIISKYELYHKGMQNKAEGLKAHIVLTTYDMITGSEFRVFKGIPRWEVLCIDEGQRLKSDNSLIFNRLRTLNSVHRILMTGTPLNNNLRELFNLLNFLDPATFKNLEDLEQRFENLNESLVTELHEMIKPYILRRIKADVLKLPPKIEIIVPISLTPLQRQIYKSVFEKNSELIQAILRARKKKLLKGK